MAITRVLQSRAVRAAKPARTGDTLYLRLPDPAQEVEEVALYVDKPIGGLMLRDSRGEVQILAGGVDGLRIDRVISVDGKHALLVELTAVWRTGAGPDLRRSICRYFADREQSTG